MPPPLADELLAQALELEIYRHPDPSPLDPMCAVPLDALNRAARLLRTAADVVTVGWDSGPTPVSAARDVGPFDRDTGV